MSEWEVYSRVLADRFNFINTFYHQEPKLDITQDDWANYAKADFVICTEVFEHINQPVLRALTNLRKLLKPDGVLIFSVPFTEKPKNKEHFPDVSSLGTCQVDGKWVVVGKLGSGEYKVFDEDVHFHGGPGSVLEMRLFGRDDLVNLMALAGFTIKIHETPDLEVGYYWASHEERLGAGRSQSYIIEARPNRVSP